MSLQGLIDTGTIKRKALTSSYGRAVGTPTTLISGWKCRVSMDFSAYARALRGRGGRESYNVVGELCDEVIRRGDILVVGGESYEIVSASRERDPYGSHHWYLRVERMQ